MNAKNHCPLPVSAQPKGTFESSAPPHPFRAAPWYDPSVMRERVPSRPRLSGARLSLVVLGGVVLPVVSVVLNHAMQVVDLGVAGVTFCLASAAGVLANMLLLRRKRRKGSKEALIEAPSSSLLLTLLLVTSLLSVVWWGYLALLFLPILPVSLIAIVMLGIGFCGLCPFFVTAISVVQTVRAARELRSRIPSKLLVPLLVAPPLLALLIATATGVIADQRRKVLDARVVKVVKAPAYSAARMHAIAQLKGREALLLERMTREHDGQRRQAMAEAYERLTDQPATEALGRSGRRAMRRRRYAIRPFFFTQDESPLGFNLVEPFNGFMRF